MDLFEILPSNNLSFPSGDLDKLEPSQTLECPICLEDNTHTPFIRLKNCQHSFCLDCFKEHLHTKIQARKVLKITCPQDNCTHILPSKLLENVLDPSKLEKYKEIVLQKANARVSSHNFCPKPGCSKPYTKASNSPSTTCTCGTKICNKCGRELHEGKDCIDALDKSFEAFVQENNLKLCIMCKTVVEKIEGCTHITCPVCDYEWCWLCGNEHTQNHGLKCTGKWNPMPPKKIVMESEPESCRKTVKNTLRIILLILLLPLRILFWPCFGLNIYGEMMNPQRERGDKLRILFVFFIICLIHGGIIGSYLYFAISMASSVLIFVIILGVVLICIFIFQVLLIRRLNATPTGRWESRNSNVFMWKKSTQVHVEDHVERREIHSNNPQLSPQAQTREELESLKAASTPVGSKDSQRFAIPENGSSENVAQHLAIQIKD